MNAVQQALLGEIPQVAADGVLGHAKAGHKLRGDDPAVTLNRREDRLSALSRQHAARYSTKMRVSAVLCGRTRVSGRPIRDLFAYGWSHLAIAWSGYRHEFAGNATRAEQRRRTPTSTRR